MAYTKNHDFLVAHQKTVVLLGVPGAMPLRTILKVNN